MEKLLIRLQSINDVREFVNTTGSFDGTVELKSGNYSVDGKSIMGIFSLDLNKAMTVCISGNDEAALVSSLAPFACRMS